VSKASLFSDQWYRVVSLKPRLRMNVRVHRQVVRDQVWSLLSAGPRVKAQRLNQAAWAFVGRCNGELTVQEVWDQMLAAEPEDVPTQNEVMQLLTQLYRAQLLDFDRAPHVELMLKQTREDRRKEKRSRLNPFAFRVGLGDPSVPLSRLRGLGKVLFGRLFCWLWLGMVCCGLVLAFFNGPELWHQATVWSATPRYLLIGWILYPVIKFIHELAHGLAVQRWGGEVREAGVSLFLLMPLPYVDASAAGNFAHRYQRAWVSGAGIAAELLVASLSVMVWAITSPGLVNDIAFSAALVGSVSTLMFNANPLIRLDGYYLLTDIAQLPNLATRSGQWWQQSLKRLFVPRYSANGMDVDPGERSWLVAYSPASWVYRIGLTVWLTLWAGSMHAMLGLAVGLSCLIWMIGLPLSAALRQFFNDLPAGRSRSTAQWRLAGLGLAVVIGACVIPVPDRVIAQGVIWLPDAAQLRAAEPGFVQTIPRDNVKVQAGSQVIQMDDPALRTQRERLAARLQGLEASFFQTLSTEPVKSRQVKDEIDALVGEIAIIDKRIEHLALSTQAAGKVVLKQPADLPGRYLKQGDLVGVVVEGEAAVVRVAVGQDQRPRLATEAIRGVEVRLAQGGEQVGLGDALAARWLRQVPGASQELPSAALSGQFGGAIATDPSDKKHLKPAQPVFLVDLGLEQLEHRKLAASLIGARVWTRFDLGYQPLAWQIIREVRSTVLARFSPIES
jgi:putative peptide zinc metalloprotease protein